MKIKLAFWFINYGISLLPQELSNKNFINNCIVTRKIKVKDVNWRSNDE